MVSQKAQKCRSDKELRSFNQRERGSAAMKSRRSKKEIQALLNDAGVKFDSKGRPPSGWYRSTPGLTGIGIGRTPTHRSWTWKPKGSFIPLQIKPIDPNRWAS